MSIFKVYRDFYQHVLTRLSTFQSWLKTHTVTVPTEALNQPNQSSKNKCCNSSELLTLTAAVLLRSVRRSSLVSSDPSPPCCGPSTVLWRTFRAAAVNRRRMLLGGGGTSATSSSLGGSSGSTWLPWLPRRATAGDTDGEWLPPPPGCDWRRRASITTAVIHTAQSQSTSLQLHLTHRNHQFTYILTRDISNLFINLF